MADGFVLHLGQPRQLNSPGQQLLAELDVPGGRYIVIAKADVGRVSTATYDAGGYATLTLGGQKDEAWSIVTKDSNRETICLNLGAEIAGGDKVRLLYTLGSGLFGGPIILSNIKISAIRLDTLQITDIPGDAPPPPIDM